jgi:predicted RNase H-like nuclease (RuvC/YqgF family)
MDAIDLKEATADQLKKERPDLFKLIERELAEATDVKAKDAEIADLKKKLQEAEEKEAAAAHREKVAGELKEAKLDEPGDVFLGVLLAEQDAEKRKALIEDRVKLVEAAGGTKGDTPGKPKSDFAGPGNTDESGGAFDFDRFTESIQQPALA